jgi:7-cyano-7-deazaguanine reductase
MERFGATVHEAEQKVLALIKRDLEQLLGVEVVVAFFAASSPEAVPFADMDDNDLVALIPEDELMKMNFEHFLEAPALLKGYKSPFLHHYNFRTDLLRSNCRVTNQPDWGDLFLYIESTYKIDLLSVVKYMVSFRKENHFHEEICEMTFKRLSDLFQPEILMVSCLYTRRGGIDICPCRANKPDYLPHYLPQADILTQRNFRQ